MKKIRFIAVIVAFASLLVSCEEDKDNTPEISSIALSTDYDLSKVIEGADEIPFIAKSNKGEDITNRCIFYVNEKVISHIFKPEEAGTYRIKAEYKGVVSNVIVVLVKKDPSRIKFKQHVLIEDYTGTWCGWCPRVLYAIDLLHKETDAAVVVAIHGGDNMSNASLYNLLKDPFKIEGFPTAIINRTFKWKTPENSNVKQITDLVDNKALLGLSISSKIENDKLVASVSVKFSEQYNNLKLVVVIIENGFKADQKNYTSYFEGSTMKDHIHNHILRESLTDIMGDAIPNTETIKGKVYQKDFNVMIPSNISNKDNINVVAFLVKSDKSVVNARSCKINEEQKFEEL